MTTKQLSVLVRELEKLDGALAATALEKSNTLDGPEEVNRLRIRHLFLMERQIKVLKDMVTALQAETLTATEV